MTTTDTNSDGGYQLNNIACIVDGYCNQLAVDYDNNGQVVIRILNAADSALKKNQRPRRKVKPSGIAVLTVADAITLADMLCHAAGHAATGLDDLGHD